MGENVMLTKIDYYKALLDLKDELADETKANNEAIEKCRDELAQMMVDEEVQKVSRNGFTYSLQDKVKYSKKAGADDQLMDLLRENGLGDLIKETVNAQTLQGAMSNMAEENGGDLPEEFTAVVNKYEYMNVAKRRDTVKF